MTVIFTILGLGLFGGGLYAVYDGWPYLVLERGFTQVIVGTVMATAGLIMLSLAWVLRELNATRRELAATGAYRHAGAEAPLGPILPTPVVPAELQARGSGPALGVGAAAVAAGAVAAALSPEDEPKAETARAERDLFGSLVAERLAEKSSAVDEAPAQPEDEIEKADPGPDLFAAKSEPDATQGERGAAPDETAEPAEVVAAMVQPVSQDEALAKTDLAEALPVETGFAAIASKDERGILRSLPHAEPELVEETETASHPEQDFGAAPPPETVEATQAGQPEPAVDEFRALRESLTSELGGSAGAISADPLSARDRFTLSDDDWLTPASGRREPSFSPPDPDPVTDESIPAWPPRTEPVATGESLHAPVEVVPVLEPEPEAPEAPVEQPVEQQDKAAEEPATSEEGVVGAYQVGDAHFTIFADGSIRARTPDGEYSFASMDELKVYLASEKSRLGV